MEGREQTGRVNHALAERINQYILEQKSSIAAISKEIGYEKFLQKLEAEDRSDYSIGELADEVILPVWKL